MPASTAAVTVNAYVPTPAKAKSGVEPYVGIVFQVTVEAVHDEVIGYAETVSGPLKVLVTAIVSVAESAPPVVGSEQGEPAGLNPTSTYELPLFLLRTVSDDWFPKFVVGLLASFSAS